MTNHLTSTTDFHYLPKALWESSLVIQMQCSCIVINTSCHVGQELNVLSKVYIPVLLDVNHKISVLHYFVHDPVITQQEFSKLPNVFNEILIFSNLILLNFTEHVENWGFPFHLKLYYFVKHLLS